MRGSATANDLATVVDEARSRAFVGRAAELASFDKVLAAGAPQRVLFLHGPGGIGKTTLLHRFRMRARAAGRPVIVIDGRDVDCTAEGLRAAVDRAAARVAARAAVDAPAGAGGRGGGPAGPGGGLAGAVLMLDGYERLGQLDAWIRDELLPSLPDGAVVVLAGRDPPSAPWRIDPGWRVLVACHCLQALTEVESVELLERAGVTGARTLPLAALGRGHPLTLALLADAAASGPVPDDLADAPDLVAMLVAQVVGDVPSPAASPSSPGSSSWRSGS
jgi:AAA ATPase domain